jgi:glucose-6-phosphate dehydrogenase assembly protein OpcA
MENPMSTATVVKPEKLLKELGSLWTQLGKEENEGSSRSAGVLRAVTMTFILGVEEGEDEVAGGEALAQLMHEHPSRAIVLKLAKDSSRDLEGRAFAQCWMPFGRRQQICCEQIEVSAGAQHFGDVVSLLNGLIAPDLPVVFWCRSARIFEHAAFGDVAAMAHKVIVDSRSHNNPIETLRWIDRQLKAGHLVGDLTWTRMTRWRQTIANVFERLDCQSFFHHLNRAVIGYAHAPVPVAATYLSAWLKSALGMDFPAECKYVESDVRWQIREVRFESALQDVVIDRREVGFVESHVNNFSSRFVFEVLDEAKLVREELAILGRDPIFAKAVSIASLV